jgi:hypothetical protein
MAHDWWTATERAMQVQEIILKTIAGQLRGIQAAEILGISARTMRRCKQRYERQGYDGLFDRRTPPPWPAPCAAADGTAGATALPRALLRCSRAPLP